ncbi:MAG: hypothetical protein SCM11_01475 [Bacillota bacterium]|nr:hypothetical protein [Bacillota bacterium]
MSRKLTRVLSLVSIITLLMIVFSGCTQTATTTTATGSTTAATTTKATTTGATTTGGQTGAPSEFPMIYRETPGSMEWMSDTSPITLTMFSNNFISDDWHWGKDRITQYITERTGVTVDIEFPPDTTGNRLTLLLASGDKLPDLFTNISATSMQYREMIDGAYVHALDELIDEHCPTLWDMLYPEEIEFSSESDGHIYFLTKQFVPIALSQSPYYVMNGIVGQRLDVIKALGYEHLDITTTDKFIEVLEAFTNKASDWSEINYPVWVSPVSLAAGAFNGMFGGVSNYVGALPIRYNMASDSLYFWFDSEAGIEELKFFNQLYRQGYLLEAAFLETEIPDLITAGKMLFFMKGNTWEMNSYNGALAQNIEGAEYAPSFPFTAPGTGSWQTFQSMLNPMTRPTTLISVDCEDPGRAIKFLQYMKSEEAHLLATVGIYEEDWELAYDNEVPYPKPIGAAAEAYGDFSALMELGIYNHPKTWMCLDSTYDHISAYNSRLDPKTQNLTRGRTAWQQTAVIDVAAGLPTMLSIASGTQEGDLNTNLQDIYRNLIVEIVLSDTDQAFNDSYSKMMTDLKSAGMEQLFELLLPKVKDTKEKLEEAGYTFN